MIKKLKQRIIRNTHIAKSLKGAREAQAILLVWLRGRSKSARLVAIVLAGLSLATLGIVVFEDRLGLNLPWLFDHNVGDVTKRVLPSVVTITSTNPDALDSEDSTILGSGVVIDPRGYIVTNYHVISRGTDYRVYLASGEELAAEVVASKAMGLPTKVPGALTPPPFPFT